VALRFRGESTHKVDTKGRVSIPAAFRRVLEEGDPDVRSTAGAGREVLPSLVIVYGDERRAFLEGYTMDAIAEVDEKISSLPRGSKLRRYLERTFNAQSINTQVDAAGRLLLPSAIRRKVGIEEEALFVAAGDTFQIWAPVAYEAHVGEVDAFADDLAPDADPLEMLDRALAAQARHPDGA